MKASQEVDIIVPIETGRIAIDAKVNIHFMSVTTEYFLIKFL